MKEELQELLSSYMTEAEVNIILQPLTEFITEIGNDAYDKGFEDELYCQPFE